MSLFETLVTLLLASALLLPIARRLRLPYPTLLALAGVLVAASPWAPRIGIDPHLALALFISPALLSAAYDTSPHELRRHWPQLLALAVIAVLLTTAAVAWLGWAYSGLPVAAAIALGAIVAPPDAAAAQAVLASQGLPRRTMTVLQGESLLNDAIALLLFAGAVGVASQDGELASLAPKLLLGIPGGVLLGVAAGVLFVALWRVWAGTHSITILEFATTFAVWLLAERLHLSAVLAVVTYAMWVARGALRQQSARDRVHSFSVWDSAVFILNVLAFLLMGLQAREIVQRLEPAVLWQSISFAAMVLVVVVAVRMAWVLSYRAILGRLLPSLSRSGGDWRLRVLIGWSGMRGVLTLATAMSLPAEFPGRDLIVLSALVVVLGTLVVQGATIAPLIRWLDIPPDTSLRHDIDRARDVIRASTPSNNASLGTGRSAVESDGTQRELAAVVAQREALHRLLRERQIAADVFAHLQEELDWRELSLTAHPERGIRET
ncbi:Na+/H+ antiporter [Lysobacter enzymogenes]|uniref:cation:proton antiporter n=1 Tax=Lysobacter enzymogenes TaxID=69 RepID=UPI00339AE2DE